MIKELLENNFFIYGTIVVGVIGMIIRIMVGIVYNKILNASLNIDETNNKLINLIRKKFDTSYNIGMNVYNVEAFVDKSVLQHRFMGIFLSTWESICGQALIILLVSMPVLMIWGYLSACGIEVILHGLSVSILFIGIFIIVDKGANLHNKRDKIRINIIDYFENIYPEKRKHRKVIKENEINVDSLLESLSEIAAEKEEWKREKEKEKEKEKLIESKKKIWDDQIIEEVLKEFFS